MHLDVIRCQNHVTCHSTTWVSAHPRRQQAEGDRVQGFLAGVHRANKAVEFAERGSERGLTGGQLCGQVAGHPQQLKHCRGVLWSGHSAPSRRREMVLAQLQQDRLLSMKMLDVCRSQVHSNKSRENILPKRETQL